MTSLRPAQICVIDDEKQEYEKLLAILNTMGLGCVHVKGDTKESLPNEPIKGLKVVFLDLHLGVEDFGNTDYSLVANVFSRVVSEGEDTPVVVIIWSKHTDEAGRFREALYKYRPSYKGRLLFSLMPDKPQDRSGGDIAVIQSEVEKIVAGAFPVDLIWAWDALVQDASRATVGGLHKLAMQQIDDFPEDPKAERQKISSSLCGILNILLKAEAGEAVSVDMAAADLLHILSSLHADKLENGGDLTTLNNAADLFDHPGTSPRSASMVSLNSMLLLGPPPAASMYAPGTLYEVTDRNGFESLVSLKLEAMEKLHYVKKVTEANKAAFLEWAKKCRPILLEISPTCDVAQKKRVVARLVAGLLIPQDIENDAKKGKEAVRALHLLRLPGESLIMLPSFNSGLVVSLDLESEVTCFKPVARIKEPLLTDLRTWVAAQNARVGYSFV